MRYKNNTENQEPEDADVNFAGLQYRIALGLGVLTLACAIAVVIVDQRNRNLQGVLQGQINAVQAELFSLRDVEGISRGVFDDLGRAAVTNVEIRVLLARHGYSLVDGTAVPPQIMPELDGEVAPGGAPMFPPPDAETELVVPEIMTEDLP